MALSTPRTSRHVILSAIQIGSVYFVTWALIAHAVAIDNPPLAPANPKSDYQSFKKEAAQRLVDCANLEAKFNRLDLYQSAISSKVYGVDVRGRIWNLSKNPATGCSLQTHYRLNAPDYELDYLGRRTWRVFYYEEKQLCAYSKEEDEKLARRCYRPAGIVSRFAPYLVH